MKRHWSAAAAILAATTALTFGSMVARAQDLGYDGGLTAGIPQPMAEFQSQSVIHEGGLHFAYVAAAEPEIHVEDGDAGNTEALPLLFRYKIRLETSGWTVPAVGGGGNPFGSSGGAQLTAEHPDGRYLRMNAGHPGVQHLDHAPSVATYVDACVWPQVPDDDQCNPTRWIDTDAGPVDDADIVGGTGGLTDGVPAPPLAEYRSDDIVVEGGRHFSYISADTHFESFTAYMRELDAAGWTITDAATHGDETSGGGAGTATDGTRHMRFSVGGSGLLAYFDACVWPGEPTDYTCPRSGHD